jgi:hypothetical protein
VESEAVFATGRFVVTAAKFSSANHDYFSEQDEIVVAEQALVRRHLKHLEEGDCFRDGRNPLSDF